MFLRAFDWALFSHVCCPFLDWRCNSGVDEYSKIGLPTLYFHCETLALEFQFFWTCQKYCCCCCCWSLVFRGPTYLQGAPLTGSTRTQSRVRTFEEESTAKWGISLVEEVLLVSNVTCGLFLVIFLHLRWKFWYIRTNTSFWSVFLWRRSGGVDGFAEGI